jgi:hypothetical protein
LAAPTVFRRSHSGPLPLRPVPASWHVPSLLCSASAACSVSVQQARCGLVVSRCSWSSVSQRAVAVRLTSELCPKPWVWEQGGGGGWRRCGCGADPCCASRVFPQHIRMSVRAASLHVCAEAAPLHAPPARLLPWQLGGQRAGHMALLVGICVHCLLMLVCSVYGWCQAGGACVLRVPTAL